MIEFPVNFSAYSTPKPHPITFNGIFFFKPSAQNKKKVKMSVIYMVSAWKQHQVARVRICPTECLRLNRPYTVVPESFQTGSKSR